MLHLTPSPQKANDHDSNSVACLSAFGSPAARGFGEETQDTSWMIYHKSEKVGMRKFKLLLMGSTRLKDRRFMLCDFCKCGEDSEDPLYPKFQREWAYYHKVTGEPEGMNRTRRSTSARRAMWYSRYSLQTVYSTV